MDGKSAPEFSMTTLCILEFPQQPSAQTLWRGEKQGLAGQSKLPKASVSK